MQFEGYPRDMLGYGKNPPHPKWPGDAWIALQFVVNYEEGGENCVLHGDPASEAFISEIAGAQPLPGVRHINMESIFEYGSRAGFWRIMRLFEQRKIPFTAFAIGMALERNPEAAAAMVEAGHEIATHGWRWINYQYVGEDTERAHIHEAIASLKRLTGERPLGWYQGRMSPQTRRLVAEEGGFLYDADSYADDLPYWLTVSDKPHLIVPYTLDVNDSRFTTSPGFNSGDDFFTYLKDSFDALYAEGSTSPKMMSVGLHPRVIGRPARIAPLARFMDYVQKHEKVWICRRIDIARHWIEHHPYDSRTAFDVDVGTPAISLSRRAVASS
ncbi:MAG: allantoinase PuuE [Hyphomicrobiaceae bacterium]